MKVTFGVYEYGSGKIHLVQSQLKGNKPSDSEWNAASLRAINKVADGDSSVSFVLRGHVVFEDRVPEGL